MISPGSMHLNDLPDAILADVAAYLSQPSRAMLAVAVTAPSASWRRLHWKLQQTTKTKAILSLPSEWDVLDFEDVEKSLASKLSDDDVGGILACIDATNYLKSLKLAGCVNITGYGLEPLRHSSIQHIDLSLVKQHENPFLESEPMLSEEAVVPILENIIDHNSLTFLMLPKVWRERQLELLGSFLEHYMEILDSSRLKCSNCEDCMPGYGPELIPDHGIFFGLQNCICYICKIIFCYQCVVEVDDGEDAECLKFCGSCERDYCMYCIRVINCGECGKGVCTGCGTIEECSGYDCEVKFCHDCSPAHTCACESETLCKTCAPSFPNYYQCEADGCSKAHCSNCLHDKTTPIVDNCDDCERKLCTPCRVLECSEKGFQVESGCCEGCLKESMLKLRETSKKLTEVNEKLAMDNMRQSCAMAKLIDDNEKLKKEVEELSTLKECK